MSVLSELFSRISRYLEQRHIRKAEEEERKRKAWEKRREEERKEYERQQRMYRRGNDFEDYVIGMFDPERFDLIHRTPTNDDTNGRFVHSMVYPDLRFRERSTGRRFWVEVKFRSHTEDRGSITWCSDNQLRNYKRTMYESRDPVFIMIGLGGTTQDPDKVFCLDLARINFTTLFYNTYAHNRVYSEQIGSLEQLMAIASMDQTSSAHH